MEFPPNSIFTLNNHRDHLEIASCSQSDGQSPGLMLRTLPNKHKQPSNLINLCIKPDVSKVLS